MRLMQAGSDAWKVIDFFQGCDMLGRVLGRGAQLCLLPAALLLPGAEFSFRPFLCGPGKLALGVHTLGVQLSLLSTCGIFCGAHCSSWVRCHRGVRSWLWLLVEQDLKLPKNVCSWR